MLAGPKELVSAWREAESEFWKARPVMGTELTISFWWAAVWRVSRVWAREIPMEPPMLRVRLKRPLALPIC